MKRKRVTKGGRREISPPASDKDSDSFEEFYEQMLSLFDKRGTSWKDSDDDIIPELKETDEPSGRMPKSPKRRRAATAASRGGAVPSDPPEEREDSTNVIVIPSDPLEERTVCSEAMVSSNAPTAGADAVDSSSGSSRRKIGVLELAQRENVSPTLLRRLTKFDDKTDIAVEGTIGISVEDVKHLRPETWLNDVLILWFFTWWEKETTGREGSTMRLTPSDSQPRWCWFDTNFWRRLTIDGDQPGYYYEGIKKWGRRRRLFDDFDAVFIPINDSGAHWVLAEINIKHRHIHVYDSCQYVNEELHARIFDALQKYLCDEHLTRQGKALSLDDWRMESPKDIPKQNNGYDCGVFVCLYGAYRAIDLPFDFTQDNILLIRQFFAHVIHETGVKQGKV